MIRSLSFRPLAGLLLVLTALTVSAVENKLLEFVPGGMEYLVAVDCSRLRSLPLYQQLAASPEFTEQRDQFESTFRVTPESCSSLIFVGGGKELRGAVLAVSVTEPQFAAALSGAPGAFRKGKTMGHDVYYLTSDDSLPATRLTLAFTFLAPGVLLATEEVYLEPFLVGLAVDRRTKVNPPEGSATAWCFIDLDSLMSNAGKRNNNPAAMILGRNIKTIAARIDFTGAEQRDLTLNAVTACRDKNAAALVAAMVPGYVGMFASTLFSDDPALAAAFMKSLKSEVAGSQAQFGFTLDEKMLTRIGEFARAMAEQHLTPPDAVPADLQKTPEPKLPAGSEAAKGRR